MTIKRLLGSAPSQVSRNKDLGNMAFQDRDGINITGGTATLAGVTQSASSTGYNFSANSTAAGKTSTLLNWYEEGVFTPVFTNLTVIGTPTYTGTYTRVGRVVFARVVATSTTTTACTNGTTTITGLPYNANGSSVCYSANGGTAQGYGTGFMAVGTVYPPTWAATASVTTTFTYTV
jgi:hypothetical protein